ncbi:hypothetical protein HRM2_37630 [Desulforapulum autotrophicum HRM2]|uniref:Uncharacterized protein n=1 Tax=Desulforapulum autotrophicum (strain ATCC 43914 / DSM 3382 / VKM B-1955 / HRM2) TaxID=177437 RepID=C0QAN8_DESAH|nr:hypothetical protein HRM2_37630 [Desulforapulum autotrophicum HRM2]
MQNVNSMGLNDKKVDSIKRIGEKTMILLMTGSGFIY